MAPVFSVEYIFMSCFLMCGQTLQQQVTNISPSPVATVVEGQNLTLKCSKTSAESYSRFTFQENTLGVCTAEPQTCSCFETGVSALYHLICNTNEVSITVIGVNRTRNNSVWKCTMRISGTFTENGTSTQISVQVGITGVTVTPSSTLKVIEGTEGKLICTTSGGLPSATVTWFMDTGLGFTDVTTQSSNVFDTVAHALVVVKSTLTLRPSRNNNNLIVYCRASNVGQIFDSATTSVDVLYSPTDPQCQYRNSTVAGRIMITQGGTLRIICTSTSNPPPTFQWTLPGTGTQAGTQLDVIDIQASQHGSYNLTVKNSMTPTGGGTETGTKSAAFAVDVQYPPNRPAFYISSSVVIGTVKIVEGQSKTIRCATQSNPAATYTWTFGAQLLGYQQDLLLSNPRSPSDAGEYICRADNTLTPTGGPSNSPHSNSSSLTLDILFPPRFISFKYGGTSGQTIPGNSISIVRGVSQPVACVAESNPESSYHWVLQGNLQLLNMNTIQTTTTRTCNVTTTMVETLGQTKITTNLSVLSIDVLYPPDVPKVTFYIQANNKKINVSSVRVLEGESFTLQCAADSNPGSSYTWNDLPGSLTGIYHINNISRTPSTQVAKCSVQNTMAPTYGSSVTGNNSTNIDIHILYGPRVLPMVQRNIVNGSRFEQNCSYIPGNPVETSFKWTRTTNTGDLTLKLVQILVIDSVQRTDDSQYTCQASNVMRPTIGSNTDGTDKGMFHLNVLFGPEKLMLMVQGYSGKKTVTVNENDTHTFSCSLESNPGSTIVIKQNDLTLSRDVNKLNISISVQSRCDDAGLYTCTGNNEHGNATPDSVEYFVKCAARPSPLEQINNNVSSAQNVNATMTFYTQAYPAPIYVWQTCKDTCTNITNAFKYNSSSNGLVSNFTILDVKQEDYGQYRVIVSNGIGPAWMETFQLIPYDRPNIPTNFRIIESTVTQTEATVTWSPGFNGGPEQTFHIQYKLKSGGPSINLTVQDSKEDMMNFTIQELAPHTTYQLVMYSQNIIGASMNTEEITLVTLAKLKESTTTTSAGLIGGVAGGSFAVILIGVIVAIFVLRKRQGVHKKKKDGFTGELMKTNREQNEEIPDEVQNPMYISAGVVSSETASPVYASPMKKTPVQSSTDVYATVDVNKKTSKGAKKDIKTEKGKKKQAKHTRNDVYENPQLATSKKAYDNKGMDENLYENNASVSTPKNVTADGLIYADLDFPNQPKGQKRLVIHGLDNKTDYAEVDLTRTAEPLPDSDSEEKKSETKK